MDEADGALFSRISSKQSDVDKMNVTRDQTCDQTPAVQGNAELETPEWDPGDVEFDIISPERSEPLLKRKGSKQKKKYRTSSSSSSENGSSLSGDFSDAIQGSRVSLHHMNVEDIQSNSASTFFITPVEHFNTEGDNSNINTNNVQFSLGLPDPESESGTRPSGSTSHVLEFGKHENMNGNQSEGNNIEAHELQNLMDGGTSGTEDDADKTTPVLDSTPKKKRPIYWRLFKALLFPMASLIIYFWDIGSDIRLAVSYKESGDLGLFWITSGCIVIPHVLMAVVDVSWVWLDRQSGTRNARRYILGVLTCGRIVRAMTYMRHIYKAKMLTRHSDNEPTDSTSHPQTEKSAKWHKDRAIEEKRDCFMLDFINAFAESAPQLFVQLYLYYAYDLELTLLRVLNLLSSWISIAWTYAAYYRCNREALKGEQDVKIIGFGFFFVSVLSALAARYICAALFLVYFSIMIGIIFLSCHFLVMILWICFKEKPKLPGTAVTPCGRYLYYIFFAFVCMFCFMNLNDTRARKRMTLFYILIYVENALMAGLTYWMMSETGCDKVIHLVILPVGCIVHVVLLVNYYSCLHPITGICYNCSMKEETCHKT